MKLKILAVIAVILVSGCTKTVTIYKPVELPVIPRPELPKLTPEQDQSIDQPAYEILVERELLLKNHIETLIEIIEINNRRAKDAT